MKMNVVRGNGKTVCIVEYATDAKKVQKTVEQLHNVFVLDRSGSMTYDIDTAIENTKDALKIIPATDLISVIWFSGAGQCKTLIKGAKNDGNLLTLLDSLKSTVGLTCFSEPMQEIGVVIEDLKALCPNFTVNLFTDGCPVVPWSYKEEVSKINDALSKWQDEVIALNTIGYGNYYDADLLKAMAAKTMFGQFIHNSKITDLSDIFTHNYTKISGMTLETVEVLSAGADIVYMTPKTIQYYAGSVNLRTIDKESNIFVFHADGDFTFSINGEDYNTADIKDAGIETESPLYALAYGLYYQGKKADSLKVLSALLGDKSLIDAQTNAFTPDERANYLLGLKDAVRYDRFRTPNTCTADYLPREDAFCVMDLLKLLAEAEGTMYVYQSNYQRIGLKTTEEANYFKRDEGMIVTNFNDLVLNKEKVNVSVRSKISGKVQLNPNQAERVGLNPVINSHIYRTQTIIKDGFLNMDTIQFVVTAATLKDLEAIEELNVLSVEPYASNDLIQKKLVTIDLTSLPVINKKYVDQSTDISDILANTLTALKLEAHQKMANYVLKMAKAELGEEKGVFATLTDEQVELLKDYGLAPDLSYVGVGTKTEEKGEDYYETRKISYGIKGASSLPSGADVLKKLESGAKLNQAGLLMAEWYKGLQDYLAKVNPSTLDDELREKIKYTEQQLAEIKKDLFENRLLTCTLNMAIVLTDYWFEGVETDAKGNMTYTEGDNTLEIKAIREKVYY